MPEVITNHLALWTSALLSKSTAGRGNNGKQEAYGIKKLREFILELAVRGKLVPQDSNDKPAAELMKKTVAEKKRLINESLIREAKPPVFPVEPPGHELPANWVWTNLFEIGEIAPRNEADDTVEASFVPMQTISEKYGVPVQHEVKPWAAIKSGFTHFREEDVVLAKITPCFQNGKSAVMRGLTNGFGAGTTELHVYRSINACTVPEYVLIYLKSPRFIGDGIPKMTGTAGQKRITRDYFAGNHFPLPPFAEQHRIVAKVNELMALCNQLEQKQNLSIEAHQTLVEALLGTLTRVQSQQELTEAWTRLANYFDTLFTTEHSIDQLKQTILQLAVMGKLVPQDPNNQPASVLLEQIAIAKERLTKEGRLRKEKQLPPLTDEEMLFQLPEGWAWIKFGTIAEFINGDRSKNYPNRNEYVDDGIPWINTGHIAPDGRLITLDMNFITREKFDSLNGGKIQAGDLVYCLRGATFGKTAFVEPYEEGAIASSLMIIRPFVKDLNKYIFQYLTSPFGKKQLLRFDNGSAQPNLSAGSVLLYVFPLPPLEEQHRIVAKIDELMALCDTLKTDLTTAQTTQVHLADAIVDQAVA